MRKMILLFTLAALTFSPLVQTELRGATGVRRSVTKNELLQLKRQRLLQKKQALQQKRLRELQKKRKKSV